MSLILVVEKIHARKKQLFLGHFTKTQSLDFLPVLHVSIQMLDALGAPEADLVVHREAISGFRTDSLLLAEFAYSYLTFCSDTLNERLKTTY